MTTEHAPIVVGADEQDAVDVDLDRWVTLATAVLRHEAVRGELTLTFVDVNEITALNVEHLGGSGPTDVVSFPLDADDSVGAAGPGDGDGVPILLGDVVICPAVAAAAAANHAGTVDDELALLVVHGILHVLGHDHADAGDAAVMRRRERELLETLHWGGPTPDGFSHVHVGDDGH